MKKQVLSQEGLKLIACVSMLIDHVGAIFFPQIILLRIIGRLAFPIFCFLLVEGAYYTRDPKRYAFRLFIGALLSELPFDFLFFGSITLRHQSVMVTLLIGYLSLLVLKRCRNYLQSLLSVIPFALLAEFLGSDYGGIGILVINLFGITRNLSYNRMLQAIGLVFLFLEIPSSTVAIAGFDVSVQLFGILAMIFIVMYSGKKALNSRVIQWIFYLFYPAHLTLFYYFSKILICLKSLTIVSWLENSR